MVGASCRAKGEGIGMDRKRHHQRWEILAEKEVFCVKPRMRIAVQTVQLPDGRIVDDYYQIGFPVAVVTIPFTSDNKIVMLRQYHHGFRTISTVLPAGTAEEGEAPMMAARRELLEETGYGGGRWKILAKLSPHPNYGCGIVYFVKASGVRKLALPNSDDLEDTELVLMKAQSVSKAIQDGTIISMGTMAALAMAKVILA